MDKATWTLVQEKVTDGLTTGQIAIDLKIPGDLVSLYLILDKWEPAWNGEYWHECEIEGCKHRIRYDDEPWCFTHSPDEGSSVSGYSAFMGDVAVGRKALQHAPVVVEPSESVEHNPIGLKKCELRAEIVNSLKVQIKINDEWQEALILEVDAFFADPKNEQPFVNVLLPLTGKIVTVHPDEIYP